MTSLRLPPVEDLEVEDLCSLPKGHRYELRDGSLVVMAPSNFWHKVMSRRLFMMLHAAGLDVFQDPGVLGGRPRDSRLADLGVVTSRPPNLADYSNLPGSAYQLVVEIVSRSSPVGEYTDRARWYAEQGIPRLSDLEAEYRGR